MLITLLSEKFKRVKDVNLPTVNQLAAEYGKRPRKSVSKFTERVQELKNDVRKINGKDRGYKRKRALFEDQAFLWPSDSTTPGQSQPSQGDKCLWSQIFCVAASVILIVEVVGGGLRPWGNGHHQLAHDLLC